MQFVNANEPHTLEGIKKKSSIGSSPGGSIDDQRNEVATRSASVPSVVYQEDLNLNLKRSSAV